MAVQKIRRGTLILVVLVGIAALGVFGVPRLKIGWHRLELRTYVNDGQDIKANAVVRVAGIDVGRVKSVVVRPERGPQAVEIVMDINTPYELKIPKDAVAELQTAGVLGETYVNIKVQNATGMPVENGGVLQSQPTASNTALLQQFADTLTKGCPPANPAEGNIPKPKPGK